MTTVNSIANQLQQLLPDGQVSTKPEELHAVIYPNPLQIAGRTPTCIVKPVNEDELQSLIVYANQSGLNLTVTSSTGIHRNGGILNGGDNVLIDLSSWQDIDFIDRRNRVCRIQPGVTYGQLLAELAKHNMTLPTPLAPRSGKSVLASVMDREPTIWPNKQWDSSDPVGSTEFFFGTGDIFRSGAGGGPGTLEQQQKSGGAQKFSSGPSQTDFHRVVQGAQGTMGILTWATLRTELKPSIQETLIAGSEKLENMLPFVYAVQRRMLGEHTFILNRTAAALLMAGADPNMLFHLWGEFPEYLLVQNIAGFERLPEERLAYHLQEIHGFAGKHGLEFAEGIEGISAQDLLDKAIQPCGEIDWRDRLHGSSLSIFFLSTLERMPAFQRILFDIVEENSISAVDIGIHIQPIVQNHACHIEFILPFNPESGAEIRRMKKVERQIVINLIEEGAFFSRPYGSSAELVWKQNPANHKLLKQIKNIFDPKCVLQRGKWDL